MEVKPGYKQTEVGVIPEDWLDPQLQEIAEDNSPICYGIVKLGAFAPNGVPVLVIRDLNLDYTSDIYRSSVEIERAYIRSRIQPNDVLISVKGTTGRVGIVPAHFKGNISRDLARIRTRKNVDPKFVFQMLQSDIARHRLGVAAVGTTRMELSIAILKQVRIPVPPTKAEQEAIAEALSDADALIEALEQLLAKKRQVKQGAMQELLTGKRRLPEFNEKQGYKQTDIGLIPEDWEVGPLGQQLRRPPTYGINAPAVQFDYRFPTYLRITDITEDGQFAEKEKVSVNHPASGSYIVEPGDLVFARTGASVGKSYLYNLEDGQLVFAGFLIRISPNPERLISGFLKYFVQSHPYWNWVRVNSMRTGQPGINGREYASLPIPIPPTLAEQTAIAETLSDMDAEIAALEEKLSKARQVKQGMMSELLTGRVRLV
jgi:type I restriction enzyme, S subunit